MRYHPLQFGLLTIGVALMLNATPVFAADATETSVSASEVTTQTLDVENVQSLRITPIHEERVSDDVVLQDVIDRNANGEFVLHRQTIIGLEPMTIFGATIAHDIVRVSGQTQPYAFVTLTMRGDSDARTEVTRATKNGRWEIRIAVDFLSPGEHITYLQTELNGVRSNELQIAKFVVVTRDSVSNSTWIFVSLITFAIILLLIASTLQIRQNRMAMEEHTKEPLVPDGHEKKSAKK